MNTSSPTPLKRSTIYVYGMIGIPLAMFSYPIAIWLPAFYAGELGVSLAAIGGMLFLARLIDVVTDPAIGFASDTISTKWGRRKPFLMTGLPVVLLGVFLVFMPRYVVGDVPGSWYLFLAITVMYFGVTLISVPYGAWGAELSGAYHERSRVTAAREFFVLAGLMVAAFVPFLMERLGQPGLVPILDAMALSIFLVMPICVLIVLWRVPEPKDVPLARVAILQSLKHVWQNKPMRHILLIILIVTAGEAFRNALSLFFMRDVIGVPSIGTLYLYYFGAGLVAIPAWLMAGKRFGKHKTFAVCLVLVAIISVLTFFLSAGDLLAFNILFLAKGACFGGLQFLPLAMLADVVDVDTAESGSSRAGAYFAVAGSGAKIATAFGTLVSLSAAGWVGFSGLADAVNTPEALTGLAFNYAIVPAILFVGTLYLTWTFPLTEEIQKHLRDKIQANMHGVDPID